MFAAVLHTPGSPPSYAEHPAPAAARGSTLVRVTAAADADDEPAPGNDRNDVRHLVKFAGKELYKGLPLAWQTFDLMHGLHARGEMEGMRWR